eukprot:1848108-Lingulodinium_polyedra.AAC.1
MPSRRHSGKTVGERFTQADGTQTGEPSNGPAGRNTTQRQDGRATLRRDGRAALRRDGRAAPRGTKPGAIF